MHRTERVCWTHHDRERRTACDCGQALSRGSPMVVLQQATEPLTRQNAPVADLVLPDVAVSAIEPPSGAVKFDLALHATDDGVDLKGIAEYDTSLFRRDTVAGMMARLERLIEAIVEAPDRPLSALSGQTTVAAAVLAGGFRDAFGDLAV